MRKKHKKVIPTEYVTWAEIDLKAIEFNFNQLKKLSARNKFKLPLRKNKTKELLTASMGVLTVIKADAYGHGMLPIAQLLDELDVHFLGVSDVREAIALRETGIKKPVLLFESTLPECIKSIVKYDLIPTICTLEFAAELDKHAKEQNKLIKVHVEVDTGMGRLGVWHKDAFTFIRALSRYRNLMIEGIFTHFPVADTDKKYTQQQIEDLHNLVIKLDKSGLIIPYIHAANSMGLAGYKTSVLNLARPGLMIYGLHPNKNLKKDIKLKPALSIKSKVIFLKNIEKGRSISYGRTFIAKKKMRVATVPIGYNDGYLRDFSNNADVLIAGVRCPIVGTVTMDQIIVDVSKVSRVKLGQEVVILGKQKKEEVLADELANLADTINYEIVCNLGNRLPRVYV